MVSSTSRRLALLLATIAALAGCSHKKEDCAIFTDALADPAPTQKALTFDAAHSAIAFEPCATRDIDKKRQSTLKDGEAIVLFKRYVATGLGLCKSSADEKDLKAVVDEMKAYCEAQ